MRQRIIKAAIAVAAVLLLIVIVSSGLTFAKSHALRSTSDTFVKEVLAGDAAKSYAMLTPDTQKTTILKPTWTDFVEGTSVTFQERQPTYVDTIPNNKFMTVDYTIPSASGLPYRLIVILYQTGAFSWQVDTFQVAQQ